MHKVAQLRNRGIGVEHECYIGVLDPLSSEQIRHNIAKIFMNNGLLTTVRNYSHSPIPEGTMICLETDASIRGTFGQNRIPYITIEMKTKILNGVEEWESIVPKAIKLLNYMGARINGTSGLHVHLSVPEIKDNPSIIRNLYNLFYRYEKVIYGLLPPSRSNNCFCRPLKPEFITLLQTCHTEEQFCKVIKRLDPKNGLNFFNLLGPGNKFAAAPHIEIRHCSGTLDPEKSRNWLILCLQMLQHAIDSNIHSGPQLPNTRESLERMLVSCGFKPNSKLYCKVDPQIRQCGKWLLKRWQQMNDPRYKL